MRRFLIWSILAVVVGLALAGGAYWAYWSLYARFQPVTISRNQVEIQRLLDEASWVSPGGGSNPVYIVGYRDNPALQRYSDEEVEKLRAAGADVRFIVFARPDLEGQAQSTPAERSTIAQLWLSRDWTLYQRWTTTPARSWTAAGLPVADGNLALTYVVEAGRQFDQRLTELLGAAGVRKSYPLILWRDGQGFLKACGCEDSRSWAFIRDDLNAPDRIDPSPVVEEGAPSAAYPDVEGDGTAYPDLPAIPSASGEQTSPENGAAAQNPPAAKGQAPAPSRAPPQAKRQDDATFF